MGSFAFSDPPGSSAVPGQAEAIGSASLRTEPLALSPRAHHWLSELRRPNTWCEPSQAPRLMRALGSTLARTPGFPAGHGVIAGDIRERWAQDKLSRNVPHFTVVIGANGPDRQPTDKLQAFSLYPDGVIKTYQGLLEASGEHFFIGLTRLLFEDGHLANLFKWNSVRPTLPGIMLRQLLVDQLATQSPQLCEQLAADVKLLRSDPAFGRSPDRRLSRPAATVPTSTAARPPLHRPWESPALVPASEVMRGRGMAIDAGGYELGSDLASGPPARPNAYRPGATIQRSLSTTHPYSRPDSHIPMTQRRMTVADSGPSRGAAPSPVEASPRLFRLLTDVPPEAQTPKSSPSSGHNTKVADWMSRYVEQAFLQGPASGEAPRNPEDPPPEVR